MLRSIQVLLSLAIPVQDPAATTPSEAPAAVPPTVLGALFDTAHLEQLAAPIALQPDSVLAQVLMASTYPIEIVEASRWLQANPAPAGSRLESALKRQAWDPSVKSLCGFPALLKWMCQHLDWCQDTGDAFLEQRAQLLDTVQAMRRKAFDSGNLRGGREFTVNETADKILVIAEGDAELTFVANYGPQGMYTGWNPPAWYYPEVYGNRKERQAEFSAGTGVVWGSALWSAIAWRPGASDVKVDVPRRDAFIARTEEDARQQLVKERASGDGAWKHDPLHRKGVGYRNPRVARQYGGTASEARVSREVARGDEARAASEAKQRQEAQLAAALARTAAQVGKLSGALTAAANAQAERNASARGAGWRDAYGVWNGPVSRGWGRWHRYYGGQSLGSGVAY